MKRLGKFGSLKEFRAFCTTCEEGTMLKAAKVLQVSQPTITSQIQFLENKLQIELFRRRGPRIKPTSEGEVLYNLVSPIVRDIDNIRGTFFEQLHNLSSGELSIAAEDSTLLYTLPSAVKKFTSDYPGIRLKLTSLTEQGSRNSVLSEASDFAVSTLLNMPSGLTSEPLFSYPLVLIASKNHPLTQLTNTTPEDIAKYRMIIPTSEFSSRHIVKMAFALNGIDYNVSLEAGGWGVIKKYVSLGLGISIVTKQCITISDYEDLAIVDTGGIFPNQSYGIITKMGKPLSEPAQKFIDILKSEQ